MEIIEIENRKTIGKTTLTQKASIMKRSKKLTNLYIDNFKKQKTQSIRIKNERGDTTTELSEIKKIIKEFLYEQLYVNKLDNLEEKENYNPFPNVWKNTIHKN